MSQWVHVNGVNLLHAYVASFSYDTAFVYIFFGHVQLISYMQKGPMGSRGLIFYI